MTKPTGRPRGRPPGTRNKSPHPQKGKTEFVLSEDQRRGLAHAYFLLLQVRILDSVMAMGSTKTADIKSVKLMLGNKLIAEAQKQGWLQHGDDDGAGANTAIETRIEEE